MRDKSGQFACYHPSTFDGEAAKKSPVTSAQIFLFTKRQQIAYSEQTAHDLASPKTYNGRGLGRPKMKEVSCRSLESRGSKLI